MVAWLRVLVVLTALPLLVPCACLGHCATTHHDATHTDTDADHDTCYCEYAVHDTATATFTVVVLDTAVSLLPVIPVANIASQYTLAPTCSLSVHASCALYVSHCALII